MLRHPVFFPIARSCSTSGRLASLRFPRIAISGSAKREDASWRLLDQTRGGIRPLPDHLLAVEEERVARRLERRSACRFRLVGFERGADEADRHGHRGDFGRRHDSIGDTDDLAHARYGALGEVADHFRVRFDAEIAEVAGVETLTK